MPKTKNAFQRYKTLDKCLSDPYGQYTIEDLQDKIGEELYDKCGVDNGVSMRQLREDIRIMRANGAPICVWKIAREYDEGKLVPVYFYGDEMTGKRIEYEYFAKAITPETKAKVKETVELLKLFQDLPGFGWIHDITTALEIEFDDKGRQKFVSFERNPDLKGFNWLPALIKHTMNKEPLRITYCPFFGDRKKIIFHPYHLKQFNNRWFLWGLDAAKDILSNLALDRIDNFVPVNIPFIPNDKVDFSTFFDYVVGVSVPDAPTETIILRFSEKRLPYVLNKPLHHSQRLHSEIPNAISLHLKLNRELEARILNYGPDVEVLAPDSLRNSIAEKVRLMMKLYFKAGKFE